MRVKDYFYAIGFGHIITCWIVFVITFMVAYLSPDKKVIVCLNFFKEANVELIFLIVGSICSIYFLFVTFQTKKEK